MAEEKPKKRPQRTYVNLNDEGAVEALLHGIRIGLTNTTACKQVGISRKGCADWLKNGRDWEEGDDPKYLDFLIRYEAAIAESECTMLERIQKAAAQEGDVKAAQWYLERLFPERYGKQQRLEVTGKDGDELIPKGLFQSAVARAAGIAESRRRGKG